MKALHAVLLMAGLAVSSPVMGQGAEPEVRVPVIFAEEWAAMPTGEHEAFRYAMEVLAAHALAQAEILQSDFSPAECQAFVLASWLRILNETPADSLPEPYRSYILERRAVENDIVPGMVAVFLSVAAGVLDENGLSAALAPAETELHQRLAGLDARYPEAAAILSPQAMTQLSVRLARELLPADLPSAGQAPRARRAAGFRLFAQGIEELLQL